MCRAPVSSRGLSRIFIERTMNIQCEARLFFTWLMSDRCLWNKAYTVCRALVPSHGLS